MVSRIGTSTKLTQFNYFFLPGETESVFTCPPFPPGCSGAGHQCTVSEVSSQTRRPHELSLHYASGRGKFAGQLLCVPCLYAGTAGLHSGPCESQAFTDNAMLSLKGLQSNWQKQPAVHNNYMHTARHIFNVVFML